MTLPDKPWAGDVSQADIDRWRGVKPKPKRPRKLYADEDELFGDIHPSAIVGGPPQHFREDAVDWDRLHPVRLGDWVRIGPYTTVDRGTVRETKIGDGTYIMGGANFGHDSICGKACQISQNVVVGGHVELGDNVRIGIGAVILPFRKIGPGARIGAGAIVTHDVPEYECWSGNPARRMYKFCENGCWTRVDDHMAYCDPCRRALWGEVEDHLSL